MKIKIEEKKEVVNNKKIVWFDQPSIASIPLYKNKFIPLVQRGDYVYQEEKIALRKKDHFPIFSSISGKVLSCDKEKIMIQNDYQNRVRNYQEKEYNIFLYNKKDVENLLFQYGVQSIKDEIEPYRQLSSRQVCKTLIINALQEEPYFSLEWFQLQIEKKQLLEILDFFIELYNFDEIFIVFPQHQDLLFEEWKNCIEDSKIKLIEMEEYYALSNTRNLIFKLKKIQYQNTPLEKGIVVFSVSTLFTIRHVLKYQRPKTRMILQFTGNMLQNNCYIEARIGTPIYEIINHLKLKRTKEIILLKGSLMKGSPIIPDNEFVNWMTPCYSVWKKIMRKEEENCRRCGKCRKVCPMNLYPVFIMESMLKNKKIKKKYVEKCIDCNLCSYVCPSHIQVHEYVKKAKEELR